MYYVVSLSGGTASAVAAERAIQRYGRAKVLLWFADTSWEDVDLYRFLDDCLKRWGGRLYSYCDGRTPLEVAEQKHIIPNNQMAPCSYALKIQPFQEWLYRLPKPLTVLTGLGWHELHRVRARQVWHKQGTRWRPPTGYQQRITGVAEDFPLLWKPLEYRPYAEVVRSWGIEPPRLYQWGFPHNNCGGRCVRQGISEWQRLRRVFPERFSEMRDWEQMQRAHGGRRAVSALCRERKGGKSVPVTLAQLEQRALPPPGQPVQDDFFACFCTDETA
jgi:hypothetical protein